MSTSPCNLYFTICSSFVNFQHTNHHFEIIKAHSSRSWSIETQIHTWLRNEHFLLEFHWKFFLFHVNFNWLCCSFSCDDVWRYLNVISLSSFFLLHILLLFIFLTHFQFTFMQISPLFSFISHIKWRYHLWNCCLRWCENFLFFYIISAIISITCSCTHGIRCLLI